MKVHCESLHEEWDRLQGTTRPPEVDEYLAKETTPPILEHFLVGWIFAQEQFYGKKIDDISEEDNETKS
ncbi:hypothetical protein FACS189444_4160 [Spirochaetia bacterium]|nr:hypothetical protein FACS189444_4160 [Spirochaetia bacterium]